MIRIVFLNPAFNTGGAEKVAYDVVTGLDSTRFQASALCLYKPGFFGEAMIAKGIHVRHDLLKNKYDIKGIFRLFDVIKKEHPDLLVVGHSPLSLFWGFLASRMAGPRPVLTIIHGIRSQDRWLGIKSGIIDRFILHRLNMVVIVSKAKLDSMQAKYNLKPEKLALLYNGVDTERFANLKDRRILRQEMAVSDTEKVIGIVGRLAPEKRHDIFLRSAAEIAQDFKGARFVIVGDGPERKKLERLADKLRIRERVIFLGERHDIPELISIFDVAVLSSSLESCSIALLEYMAGARPIVATDAGGNPELIINNESGLIVQAGNPDTLTAAITDLLNRPDKAEAFGKAARKRLEANFTLKESIGRMEAIFIKAISNQG